MLASNRCSLPIVLEILELLESTAADQPLTSPAALLHRAEGLLLSCTGATGVDAFLVDHWFHKILHFSPVGDGDGDDDSTAAAGAGDRDNESLSDADDTGSQGEKQREQQGDDVAFRTRAVCDIGEGIAGTAAMTGRKLRIRDCSAQRCRRQKRPSFGTDYQSGSLVCWPVRGRTSVSTAAAATGTGEPPLLVQLEDVDCNAEYDDDSATAAAAAVAGTPQDSAGAVLAVLQVHCADGELSAEALEILHGVGRLLAPLLTEALARDRDYVRRRSTEALLSLSDINPRDIGLIPMIEEVVRVAQSLTEAARVCFFFVDDVANELWVAKSVDFDDARIKIGEGLCGHAAATGGTVNVIDSYEDSRFDGRWDKQTGFVTKSVLCVPIPPPDRSTLGYRSAAASNRWTGRRGADWRGGGTNAPTPTGGTSASSHDSVVGAESSTPVASNGSRSQPKGPGPAGGRAAGRPAMGRRSSKLPARPLAVVEVINKRGRGVFNEHDEEALVRLCSCVESLLRRKAAEVSLLWSGMTERSLIRKSNGSGGGGGGGGGASSNSARFERAMMRLYSEVALFSPVDGAALGEQRAIGRAESTSSDGGGGGYDGRRRTPSDNGGPVPAGEEDDFIRRRDGSDSLSLDGAAAAAAGSGVKGGRGSGSGGGGGGVGRTLREERAREESELVDLSMNLFDMNSGQLLSLVQRFFRNMGLMEKFQIPDRKMQNFVRAVEQRYQPNSFHNLIHAVSVTHASFAIVKTTFINSLLRPLDKLALLVAAFCHDIDHPGNNNAYEVNSLSPLALQHGDSSVLERHHVFVTYQVLLEEGGANNIFSGLTRAQFRDVRQTIVHAILGTDMSRHMQHCADVFQFSQKVKHMGSGRSRRGLRGVAAAGVGAGMNGSGNCGGGGKQGTDLRGSCSSPGRRRGRVSAEGAAAGSKAGAGEGEGERTSTQVGAASTTAAAAAAAVGAGGVDPGSPTKKRSRSEACVGTAGVPRRRGGAGGGGALSPTPPQAPEHVFSVHKAEDRSFLTQTVLHCADLSGQVLDKPLAVEWGRRILEEFQLQATLESNAGLPLTTVASGDLETTMKGQHFFASKIVKPLWEPFVVLFPNLDPLLENLNNNCEYYYEEGLRLEQQRLSAAAAAAAATTAAAAAAAAAVAPSSLRREGAEAAARR